MTGRARTRRAGLRRARPGRAHRHPRLLAPDPRPVTDDRQRILRRPYNYDGVPTPEGDADSRLVFASYQADIAGRFLTVPAHPTPARRRDLLNEWTTPIGSAVFAVPPGCPEGGWIGRQLLG
ncbi:hypothetical protein V2I01_34190 [Micromonospora sp. BRA006-A]|nr:hypothetical protein [Micromonospora sp. BRA006-A]